MNNLLSKICTKCNIDKPIIEFDTNGILKSGKKRLHSWCKSCLRTHNTQWHKANKQYFKNWAKENPEKMYNSRMKWLKRNPERRREVRQLSYNRHKESSLEYARQYRLLHPEKIKAYNATYFPNYYDNHREEYIEYQRHWRNTLMGKIIQRITKLKRRAAQMGATIGDVDQLIRRIKLSPSVTCYLCGNTLVGKDAHIDHIIPLARGGVHSKENIAPTHRQCNQRKGAKLLEEMEVAAKLRQHKANGGQFATFKCP